MAPQSENANDLPGSANSWSNSIGVYRDRRMLTILSLAFANGLPVLLFVSTLVAWFEDEGISFKTVILLSSWVSAAYTFKILLAPIVDSVSLPLLTRWLGQRRGWLILSQLSIIFAIIGLGSSDPAHDVAATLYWATMLAFASAIHDLVVDAYRIEILHDHEQGAGAAMSAIGHRVGYLVSGTGAIWLSEYLRWFWVYAVLSALVLVGVVTVLLCREPPAKRCIVTGISWVWHAFAVPVKNLLSRRGCVVIIAFILLFAFVSTGGRDMARIFYEELGFSGSEITSNLRSGSLAVIAGLLIGGASVVRSGLLRTLLFGAALHMATSLLFVVQAVSGHDLTIFAATSALDNLTGGIAAAALTAYISSLCDSWFTATQYQLLLKLA